MIGSVGYSSLSGAINDANNCIIRLLLSKSRRYENKEKAVMIKIYRFNQG